MQIRLTTEITESTEEITEKNHEVGEPPVHHLLFYVVLFDRLCDLCG